MANRYITTRYGTRINVTGLTPEQVARVRSTAEDNGAYGGKGAALAQQFAKKNAAAAKPPVDGGNTITAPGAPTGGPYSGNPLGVDPKSGDVDPTKATETIGNAEVADTNTNFDLNNPGTQTDAFGNTQEIVRDPVTGKVSVKQKVGQIGQTSQDAFLGAADSFKSNGRLDLSGAPKIDASGSGRQRAEDANYNYITKDYATRKKQELEATKQELAQRGIPIDPSPNSLYGRSIREIENKYQALDDQAKNQAITQGNQTFSTDVAAQNTANSAFVNAATAQHSSGLNDYATTAGIANSFNPNFNPYQGAQTDVSGNLQNALSSIAGFNAQKYATDKNYKAQMDQIAAQKQIARMNNANRGGGSSGGGGDAGFIIGGEAP